MGLGGCSLDPRLGDRGGPPEASLMPQLEEAIWRTVGSWCTPSI